MTDHIRNPTRKGTDSQCQPARCCGAGTSPTPIETMSPARLVVALYDRAVLDLERAESRDRGARTSSRRTTRSCTRRRSSSNCCTASTPSAGPPASSSPRCTGSCSTSWSGANVHKDATRVDNACQDLVTPLRDAWREAAGMVGATPRPGRPVTTDGPRPGARGARRARARPRRLPARCSTTRAAPPPSPTFSPETAPEPRARSRPSSPPGSTQLDRAPRGPGTAPRPGTPRSAPNCTG